MKPFAPLLLLALGSCLLQKPPRAPPAIVDSPEDVAEAYWEVLLTEDPLQATALGDRRFDAALPDLSAPARADTLQKKRALAARLKAINAGFLHGDTLITARFVAVMLHNDLETEICQRPLWDVDQLAGVHLALASVATVQVLDSAAAVAHYVTRLHGASTLLAQHTANLRQGLAEGYAAPRVLVSRVIAQLGGMLAQPAAATPYVTALDHAADLSPEALAVARKDTLEAVRDVVQPALAAYRDFLAAEYLPRARQDVAVTKLPDGAACYRALIQRDGGVAKAPEELHSLGEAELARLREAMVGIARGQGFATIAAYSEALGRAPEQHLGSREALLQHHAAILARAEAALPRAFSRTPVTPLVARSIEAFRERDAPAAYYEPASLDGKRPAIYYLNTYEPATRLLYNAEALAFHEGMPGHHLQIALAQQSRDLPRLRRHAGATAFVEGWALYAELLADELGLYSSPATRFGMLNFQAWRAARLVVDTGLHAGGWTRDQAVAFMRENLALPEEEIANEVDRYIVWPAQALAYMSGRMEIQALRREAAAKLGGRFDLRRFHDTVLGAGAVPLPVLRHLVSVWASSAAASSG
jgi:uncharacterized protein (DUF885 family)